jgi:alpha-tubulin suppressor-like RCC1 family protein
MRIGRVVAAAVVLAVCGGCGKEKVPSGPGNPDCGAGQPCSRVPVAVAGGHLFESVTTGLEHSCGITAAGSAYCWGSNRNGQLGAGTEAEMSSTPIAVSGGLRFSRISAGALHTCALTDQARAYCWGNGASGALGTGLLQEMCGTAECSRVPRQVIGGHSFGFIAAGASHTCALTAGFQAYCWGSNGSGELGTGGFFSGSSLPELVETSVQFRAVSAGNKFTCAVSLSNEAWCWGSGVSGALGYEPETQCPNATDAYCSTHPAAIATSVLFQAITAGDAHMCALTIDSQAVCWGSNGGGQLGLPGVARAALPTLVPIQEGQSVRQIASGNQHSCAVVSGDDVYCWGQNAVGEVGAGIDDLKVDSPQPVSGPNSYRAVSVGGSTLFGHSCALTTSGSAYCWGSRLLGQIGDGK